MTLRYSNEAISYDITIAPGALAQAGDLFCLQRKVLVVTDKGVPEQYAAAILNQCGEGWLLTLEGGEEHKNIDSVQLILSALTEHGFTRGDALVAVGGGVVGDTVGFAAACYMRGIDWYNVPTTLLSQVDSSVGGKTGVNFHGIKNLVGAFHHPSGVLIDTLTLDTLSPRLFAEGLAEVIKMAATSDAALFETLESTTDIRSILPDVIASALRIKISVVESDPTEHGLRAVLNFGHTIGHAIEAASAAGETDAGIASEDRGRPWPREWEGPAPSGVGGMSAAKSFGGNSREVEPAAASFYHGEAVAVGMLYMAEGEAKKRIGKVLKKYGLPTEDPFSTDELMEFASHDKKKRGGKVKLVKVNEIGSFRFEEAGLEELRQIIQARKI